MIHADIGYAGPREGITSAQEAKVLELLAHKEFRAHHGDCIGGDARFDAVVRTIAGCHGVTIRPSNMPNLRAFCAPRYPHDIVCDPKPPLERNADMIAAITLLVATPESGREELRSGTWQTIRLARRAKREIWIISPDGGLLLS